MAVYIMWIDRNLEIKLNVILHVSYNCKAELATKSCIENNNTLLNFFYFFIFFFACYTTRYWLWKLVHTLKCWTMMTKMRMFCHQISIVLFGPGWWAGKSCRNHHKSFSCWSVTHCTWDIVLRDRMKWSSVYRVRVSSLILSSIQVCSSTLCPSSEGRVLWLLW